jgi:U3 small nucleolar RNA-associated protein 15
MSDVAALASATPDSSRVAPLLQVLVYDGRTHALKKTVARFPDTAYCGTLRADGKLLAAGCETGLVQVFDLATRSVLRRFTTHARPTRAVRFTPDKTHVLSGSDDATVRLWDLATGEQALRLDGHADYVRCAACASDTLFATGSYDHTVKLWDARAKAAAMSLEHGAPVEDVTIFLGARLCASSGSTHVALWDLAAGGRPLARLGSHQKTVTSVSAVDVRDAAGRSGVRLLTSALDGHVKVFDLDTFRVAHAYRYPAAVTAAAVSPDLSCLVVGMADRTLVVRRHRRHGAGALEAIGARPVAMCTAVLVAMQSPLMQSWKVVCCNMDCRTLYKRVQRAS